MSFTWKQALFALSLFCGVIAVVVGSFFLLTASGFWMKPRPSPEEARRCLLEWGRLAPFPASAGTVPTTTGGNAFTRSFRASFRAPAADIERWLQASPGTREATEGIKAGRRHYEIRPGGSAASAEVDVDDARHEVSVYVYWS